MENYTVGNGKKMMDGLNKSMSSIRKNCGTWIQTKINLKNKNHGKIKSKIEKNLKKL